MGAVTQFQSGVSGNPRGRPRGSKNKLPLELRALVAQALEQAGGVDYLVRQAQCNPTAFLTLVGKLLPARLDASREQPPVTIVVRRPW